jgi:hypothetical protein
MIRSREETLAVVALLLSFLAVVVALWAAWSSRRMARATDVLAKNDAERRSEERKRQELAEAAAKKAKLRVHHEKSSDEDYLVVTNEGPALARHVGMEVVSVEDSDRVPQLVVPSGLLPVEELRLEDPVRFLLDIVYGDGPSLEVRLTWDDGEEGRHDERRRVQLF